MAVAFEFRNTGGSAFSGTSAASLIGGTLPEIPVEALDIVTEPFMRFSTMSVARYLNDSGGHRNIELDFLANDTVLHRANLIGIAANSQPRTLTVKHDVIVTDAALAIVTCEAAVSTTGSGSTSFNTGGGNDTRFSTTAVVDQAFDTAAPVTVDIQAALSTVNNIATHALTPLYVEIVKANVGAGGGGTTVIVDGGEVHTVASEAAMLALAANEGDFAVRTDQSNATYILSAEPASTLSNWLPLGGGGGASVPYQSQIMYSCIWLGSAYEARPNIFRPVQYQGPVQPNGINSPGGPFAADPWDDTTGA